MQKALSVELKIPLEGVGNERIPVSDVVVDGVHLAALRREQLTRELESALVRGAKGWFSYFNIQAANLVKDNAWLLEFFKSSLVTYCDGMGVRVGASLLGKRIPERIALTDWIDDVARVAARLQSRVFMLGATQAIVEQAATQLRIAFPNLHVVGTHHGYLDAAMTEEVIHEINRRETDLLIVGMGMPLQEKWITHAFDCLRPMVILNAGSCFDYVAGTKRRCPSWMSKTGFEWLFRFFQEPRRLWKRYLVGNPRFLLRMLGARLNSFL